MEQAEQKRERISFNDLARHSAWVKRLLSLEEFPIRRKTEEEVLREFEAEKWHSLLEECKRTSDLSLDTAEAIFSDLSTVDPYYDSGVFYLDSNRNILNRHLDLYEGILLPHMEGTSALVELGAGFGSKILGLAKRPAFSNIPLVGAEFTRNGREVMNLLNASREQKMKVGHCDFRSLTIDPDLVPENATIFTSYSAHYVPELAMEFADYLLDLKPKVIVHFEPIYELLPSNSVYGLMCQRYTQLNGYTRNLLSVVNNSVEEKKGTISRLQSNCLSGNPFLPISVLEWHPQLPR